MTGQQVKDSVLRVCASELNYFKKNADEEKNPSIKSYWLREMKETMDYIEEITSTPPEKFVSMTAAVEDYLKGGEESIG